MRLAPRPVAATAACLFACAGVHAGSITVYSALENDEISVYLAAARKALPDVQVHVLRLSSGDLAARLIAESGHPRNDVIWGEALTDMLDPRIAAELAPISSPQIAALPPRYRDADGRWFAPTGYVTALCVNTAALRGQHLPMPTRWDDLTKPAYKGQLVMPDPQSSGTGYMMVAGVLQDRGETAGWSLLKQLSPNVAQYTKSGSNPCKLARTGEYPIGVSFAFVAMQAIKQGFPIKLVVPQGKVGYELEASGLMKSAANPTDAKRFLDWTASAQAKALYRQYKGIVAGEQPTPAQVQAGLPADIAERLAPIDFKASAAQRAAVITRWKQDIAH